MLQAPTGTSCLATANRSLRQVMACPLLETKLQVPNLAPGPEFSIEALVSRNTPGRTRWGRCYGTIRARIGLS
jgi:hypothetical protein